MPNEDVLSTAQAGRLLEILVTLQGRDGPRRLRAIAEADAERLIHLAVAAVVSGRPLPDLHGLAPTVHLAARALQGLATTPRTRHLVDGWLATNLSAAFGTSPLEDARNALLVEVWDGPPARLRHVVGTMIAAGIEVTDDLTALMGEAT